jgi:hypothetical protein
MKLQNPLEITFYADNDLGVTITHNDVEQQVQVVDTVTVTLTLEPNKDHVISIEQQSNSLGKFLYVKKIKLAGLNITKFMHEKQTCKVIDKYTSQQIADFIEDLGEPDRMIISIPNNFYLNMLSRQDLIDF